ncbi:unnamed protein product, partial [Symbiodinium sp. KB8]
LEYLHFQRVLHLDIKPSNILMSEEGAKLADFGTAAVVPPEAAPSANSFVGKQPPDFDYDDVLHEPRGTPAFMAPELFQDPCSFSGRAADVYSLGATLFMLVTGSPPIMAANELELAAKHAAGVRPEWPVSLGAHLTDLLQHMLEPDPAKRATLAEVMAHDWTTLEGIYPLPPTRYVRLDAPRLPQRHALKPSKGKLRARPSRSELLAQVGSAADRLRASGAHRPQLDEQREEAELQRLRRRQLRLLRGHNLSSEDMDAMLEQRRVALHASRATATVESIFIAGPESLAGSEDQLDAVRLSCGVDAVDDSGHSSSEVTPRMCAPSAAGHAPSHFPLSPQEVHAFVLSDVSTLDLSLQDASEGSRRVEFKLAPLQSRVQDAVHAAVSWPHASSPAAVTDAGGQERELGSPLSLGAALYGHQEDQRHRLARQSSAHSVLSLLSAAEVLVDTSEDDGGSGNSSSTAKHQQVRAALKHPKAAAAMRRNAPAVALEALGMLLGAPGPAEALWNTATSPRRLLAGSTLHAGARLRRSASAPAMHMFLQGPLQGGRVAHLRAGAAQVLECSPEWGAWAASGLSVASVDSGRSLTRKEDFIMVKSGSGTTTEGGTVKKAVIFRAGGAGRLSIATTSGYGLGSGHEGDALSGSAADGGQKSMTRMRSRGRQTLKMRMKPDTSDDFAEASTESDSDSDFSDVVVAAAGSGGVADLDDFQGALDDMLGDAEADIADPDLLPLPDVRLEADSSTASTHSSSDVGVHAPSTSAGGRPTVDTAQTTDTPSAGAAPEQLMALSAPESARNSSMGLVVGVAEDPGPRTGMEDRSMVLLDMAEQLGLEGAPETAYFGIFDGHNGDAVAEALAARLHLVLAAQGEFEDEGDMSTALEGAFAELDAEICEQQARASLQGTASAACAGATACVAVLRWQAVGAGGDLPAAPPTPRMAASEACTPPASAVGGFSFTDCAAGTGVRARGMSMGTASPPPPALAAALRRSQSAATSPVFGHCGRELVLYMANAGDCRAVLSHEGLAVNLTQDHKPKVQAEKARIEAAGGWIANGRLNGVLGVSRAFGDAEHKAPRCQAAWGSEFSSDPLTAAPEVTGVVLCPGDEFLIIASDGLWDVLSSQEAVNFTRRFLVERSQDVQLAAAALVKKAMTLSTVDNTSVAIIGLNQAAQPPLASSGSGQVAAVAETRVKRTLSHHVERARAGQQLAQGKFDAEAAEAAFAHACSMGAVGRVRELLELHATHPFDLFKSFQLGSGEGLVLAARGGRLVVVRLVLDYLGGLQLTSRQPNEFFLEYSFASACLFGHLQVVREFLWLEGPLQVDTNAVFSHGVTALVWACSNGHLPVVHELLALKGAQAVDVNATIDGVPEAAFAAACRCGQLEVVQYLLKLGGDRQVDVHACPTALVRACESGSVEVVQSLLALQGHRQIDVHAADEHGPEAAFRAACQAGHVEVVELLLGLTGERRVNVHASDDAAFRRASYLGRSQVVRLLLALEGDRAVDVHAEGSSGADSALRYACARGHLEMLELLLSLKGDQAFDVHLADAKGPEALLRIACAKGRVKCLRCLLSLTGDRYVDVHAPDDEGPEAPLWTAVKANQHLVVRELLALSGDRLIDVHARERKEPTERPRRDPGNLLDIKGPKRDTVRELMRLTGPRQLQRTPFEGTLNAKYFAQLRAEAEAEGLIQ